MSCLFVNRICSLVYRIFVKFVLKDIICGKIRITTSKGIDFVQHHNMKHPYKMVRMSLEKKIVLWIDLVEFFSVSLLTKKLRF